MRFGAGLLDGPGDGVQVLPVQRPGHLPAVGRETARHILQKGDVGIALDGDAVVVVEDDELAQLQRAGQRGRFRRHPLLQIAVRGQDIGMVVDEFVAGAVELRRQPAFRQSHPDGVGEPLPQRAGGDFHARRQAVFRVAGRLAAPLPEPPQFVQRQVIARQMQQRIQQGRGVAGGKHEAVAVGPLRVGRVVLQEAIPQRIGHRRRPHRRAGMPGAGLLHRVNRQKPDGVDGQLVKGRIGQRRSPASAMAGASCAAGLRLRRPGRPNCDALAAAGYVSQRRAVGHCRRPAGWALLGPGGRPSPAVAARSL